MAYIVVLLQQHNFCVEVLGCKGRPVLQRPPTMTSTRRISALSKRIYLVLRPTTYQAVAEGPSLSTPPHARRAIRVASYSQHPGLTPPTPDDLHNLCTSP
jgi:hypothetical protein